MISRSQSHYGTSDLNHIMASTNMSCLTPDAALSGDCGFLSANMYARSLFGERQASGCLRSPSRSFTYRRRRASQLEHREDCRWHSAGPCANTVKDARDSAVLGRQKCERRFECPPLTDVFVRSNVGAEGTGSAVIEKGVERDLQRDIKDARVLPSPKRPTDFEATTSSLLRRHPFSSRGKSSLHQVIGRISLAPSRHLYQISNRTCRLCILDRVTRIGARSVNRPNTDRTDHRSGSIGRCMSSRLVSKGSATSV